MAERAIVNYGVYQFTPEERECFRFRLTAQVEREPVSPYKNFKYQKPQSFYGYAQVMFGQWVYQTIVLEYDRQIVYEWRNDLAQMAILLYCATEQTRDNILSLTTCIPGCVLTPGNPAVYGLWKCPADRIVFKLSGTTTLLVNTDIQLFDNPCSVPLVWADESYTPPPDSETVVPPNPLDDPYDIPTPPYDGDTQDNGETYSPERPPEPIEGGGEARNYRVTVTFTRHSYNSVSQVCTVGNPEGVELTVPGPLYGLAVRAEPTFNRLVLICSTSTTDDTPRDESVATGAVNAPSTCNGFPTYEVASIVPL